MEQQKIIDLLTVIFKSVFKDESIVLNPEMTAKDVSAWDSLTHMIMITEVEDRFGVKFSLKELNKMKNVGTLIELLAAKTT